MPSTATGAADRQITHDTLPALPAAARVLQFGSYALAVEPVGSALRALAARERERRLIAYDPNVRLNVEPDLAHWRAVVEQMVSLAHLVKVSDEDLGLLYPAETPEQVAARWLRPGRSLVVVTRGGHGASAWTARRAGRRAVADDRGGRHRRRRRHLPGRPADLARRARRADARGAGGARCHASLEALLRFAARAAAITCSRRGADMPRRDKLN